MFCRNTGAPKSNFESSADVSIFLSLFFWSGGGCGWDGGFTVIYFNVFLHESQPHVTAGCFSLFIPSTKAAIIIVVPSPPPTPALTPLSPSFVCSSPSGVFFFLLNRHVRPVKTAPRQQHIPDKSFNGGFTYQADEK